MRGCVRLLTAVGLAWIGAAAPAAQEPAPTFQFVSIRFVPGVCPPLVLCIGVGGRMPSRSPSSMSALPGGRFEARNQTFENLARVAFGFEGVDPRRGVVSTPRFLGPEQDRFDITAVADREWSVPPPGEVIPAELRQMLRALLEDRFQMKARLETKNVDVYAVRLSNPNGEPAPGLRPSSNACLGPYTDPPADDAAGAPVCPFRLEPTRVEAGAVTMTEVARIIARIDRLRLDRVVVDGTGLQGTYDLALSIDMPLTVRSSGFNGGGVSGSDTPVVGAVSLADRWPLAIREALQQQLGLRLDKAKLPIPTLTIKHAKRPSED